MDIQSMNFPVELSFNNSTNTWDGELTSLFDYVILDSNGVCFIGSSHILMANGEKNKFKVLKEVTWLSQTFQQIQLTKLHIYFIQELMAIVLGYQKI